MTKNEPAKLKSEKPKAEVKAEKKAAKQERKALSKTVKKAKAETKAITKVSPQKSQRVSRSNRRHQSEAYVHLSDMIQQGKAIAAGKAAPPNMPKRLPVVLVHGVNARDESITRSDLWGRIPDVLRANGFSVWFGNQDSWGTVEDNAHHIAQTILTVLEKTEADQVHIVAHSKGGLDSRRAVHLPELEGKIASLTTLATPVRGLKFCDMLAKSKVIIPHVVKHFVNLGASMKGDEDPKSWDVLQALTTEGSAEIIHENPDLPTIVYRSYAFVPETEGLKAPNIGGMIIGLYDGHNDGIVPLWSAGNEYLVVTRVKGHGGYTHDDCIDQRERSFTVRMPDDTVYPTVPDFVLSIMKEVDDKV